ncbi:MAG: DUF975 family protein [Agathobacter sp.]
MWTRAQLKEKAKAALKVNYWKMILVSALATLLIGGTGISGTGNIEFSNNSFGNTTSNAPIFEFDWEDDIYGDGFDYNGEINDQMGIPSWDELENILGEDLKISENEYQLMTGDLFGEIFLTIIGIFLVVFLIVTVIAIAISLVMTAFIFNPIEVGSSKFFLKTLEEPAQVKEVAFAFDNSYKNIVKVMFFRTLYTMLWSLLFVIPGIIKSYEYRMIPYLMAENPNLSKEQAFALSKQMMMGQKWSAFVLDLSFIGWHILSAFTFGILEIFYVAPYIHGTNAALYEELSSAYGRPAQNTYVAAPYQPVYSAPEQETEE